MTCEPPKLTNDEWTQPEADTLFIDRDRDILSEEREPAFYLYYLALAMSTKPSI